MGAATLAIEKARKSKLLPRDQADRQEAAVLLGQAKDALRESLPKKALEYAEKAKKFAPDWLPASLVLAEAQIVLGYERAALRTIERAWSREPHPQLVPLVQWAARPAKAIESYQRLEKLTRGSRAHPASLMALADAALKADLWGEARRLLMLMIGKGFATQTTYQMLAHLERREKGSETLAASWLAKAVIAPPDPQWLCASCGAAHKDWQATCESCGAFNRLVWDVAGKSRGQPIDASTGAELLGYWG